MPQYQTFDDASGHSDSAAKLESLRLPTRLENWSVLDIACNEGYFCQAAWERGAGRVVGLDRAEEFIVRARERDKRTEYRLMDWDHLNEMDEKFDLVLLLSALHYASDPGQLLRDAFARLTRDGMLVLECGLAPGGEAEWKKIERPRGDTVVHPTFGAIREALPGAIVRKRGPSVSQPGDPLPRAVFRIERRRPEVLLVEGRPGSGKSTVSRMLMSEDSAAVSLDHMIWTLSEWCTDEALVKIRTSQDYQESQVGEIGRRIAASDASDRFAREILERRPELADGTRSLAIIEGDALSSSLINAAFTRRLMKAGVYVWHLRASDMRPQIKRGR